jgi:hypothetical protein
MASRKEEKERKRQQRLELEADAEQQARRRRTYGIVAGTVLVLGVIAAAGLLVLGGGGDSKSTDSSGKPTAQYSGASKPPAQTTTDLFAAAKKAGCELKNPTIAGRTHIPSSKKVVYATNPPTSGDHDQVAQPDGVYTVYPQPRHAVHSLEGGRVVIQYNPDKVNKQKIDTLGGVYNEDNLYMLMFPNPTMDYAVAVSAWGHLAGCKKVNAATYDVIRAFVDRYRDQAPESAASHQAAAGQPGWPGPTPPPHQSGNIAGS